MIQIAIQKIITDKESGRSYVVYIAPKSGPILVHSIRQLFLEHSKIVELLSEEERVNAFYVTAHHNGVQESVKLIRSATSFDRCTILWWDIDGADQTRCDEYAEILSSVLSCQKEHLTVNKTGGGIHLIANLKYPITKSSYFSENRAYYKHLGDRIGILLKAVGLPGKMDPNVFDAARVLRLPGTINRKPNRADSICEQFQFSEAVLDIDLKRVSGWAEIERENVLPDEIKRNYPAPDLSEIVKECRFVESTIKEPETVHEGEFFTVAGILAACPDTSKATINGKELSPREIANHIFENATDSASLTKSSFDEKWEQASKYGAKKCVSVNALSSKCNVCPHQHKIPTPLALRSTDYISTENAGFWVYNSKGQPTHPHYGDLSRLYKAERSYTVLNSGRIFNFDKEKYVEVSDIYVKNWIEKKVSPIDPLRESHRLEFLHKIKASGAISYEEEKNIFEESLYGKLNCKNGILDIISGDMIPHTSKIGFTNILPFEYTPDQTPEFFLEWLNLVTQNRSELVRTILDVMAYCIWPAYDDHIFVYMIGDGGNGKSTLSHLISHMLGKSNVSNVSVSQLTKNRFAPASLENKMVNLSGESSSIELDFEEINILKSLSDGSELQVERKQKDGFTLKNKAKLIFLANHPPKFSEQGDAVKRRLVVIPFDYKIEKIDDRVGDRLLAETPKILSLLVRTIQKNIQENGGKFKVFRGGAITEKARKEMFIQGDTSIEWAKEHLESSENFPDDYFISTEDAFEKYKNWCKRNGYTFAKNSKNFKKSLFEHFLAPSLKCSEENRRIIENKKVRVFLKTRYKKEEVSYVED